MFDRTDLMEGVSASKFDADSDFEVRFALPPQKTDLSIQKRSLFSMSKHEMLEIV